MGQFFSFLPGLRRNTNGGEESQGNGSSSRRHSGVGARLSSVSRRSTSRSAEETQPAAAGSSVDSASAVPPSEGGQEDSETRSQEAVSADNVALDIAEEKKVAESPTREDDQTDQPPVGLDSEKGEGKTEESTFGEQTDTCPADESSSNPEDVSTSQSDLCMGGGSSRSAASIRPIMKIHHKARCEVYPRTTDIKRFPVPDDKVSWDVEYPEYCPLDYTAPSVSKGPVWADVDVRQQEQVSVKWNALDGKLNRKSHTGKYTIENSCPQNPVGRTGIVGRGLLGRWGPNHAADPIVTRWKRDAKGEIVQKSGSPVAQFIAVQRRDNQEWAIPGGMVDAGEVVSMTIKREFGEETLNTLEASPEEKKLIEQHINELFRSGNEIYRGYVDDPRNTDNAWMETIAMNFHDGKGDSVGRFSLKAGDDAMGVEWLDLDSSLQLYASHVDFLYKTALKLKASW